MKTLKDIIKLPIWVEGELQDKFYIDGEETPIYGQGISKELAEELTKNSIQNTIYTDLRQSAIEDIKSYLKRKEEINVGYEHSKPLRIEMYELNAKIEYIKEKFNLMDDDLNG